ncbi:MAG: PAS domain S-box protein [Chloroflexi bacterium]|nr:PAS domain S-box protein [Chloroflexota bacterium]
MTNFTIDELTAETDRTVLVVEDDKDLNQLISRKLRRAGYKTDSAQRGSEAIEKIGSNDIELLVLDYQLPDMTANEMVESLKEMGNEIPFIMLTGQGNEHVAVEMMKLGARDYLVKDPESIESLPNVLRRVLRELSMEIKLGWTESQLRESEERYRDLFENASDLIQSIDKDGKFVYVNRSWLEVLGYEWSEVEGLSFFNVIAPNQVEYCKEMLLQITQGQEFRNVQITFITKDECEVFVEGNVRPRMEDEQFVATIGIFHDITERLKSDEIIRKQAYDLSKRLKELHCLYGLSKAAEEPGTTLEQLIQSTVNLIPYALQYPDFTCAQVTFDNQVFSSGNFAESMCQESSDIIVYGEHAGTLKVWYTDAISTNDGIPFLDEERELINALSEQLARFIEYRQAEEALIESEERFRQMSELSPFPVWICNCDGKTEYINPQFTILFGYPVDDIPACKPWPAFMQLHKECDFPIEDVPPPTRGTNVATKQEFEMTCKNGDVRIVSVRSLPMNDEKTYMVFHDITEPKRIEQMKTDFVSMVSHQLRTPVGIIRGYIDNMLSGLTGDLTEKQILYLKDMEDISAKNYNLVADLLNASRIERGVISVEIEPVDLATIIDRATGEYRESIQDKGLNLFIEFEKEGIQVLADEDKMVEALCNIINNAVKFTSEGYIRIQAGLSGNHATVHVSDTGKGMSEDILEKLFSKNQILSGSPTPDGGSGLGLYIAKEFMELQHGDISASSVEGQGSCFLFKIPLLKQNSQNGGTTW